jgi:hypothetical protein
MSRRKGSIIPEAQMVTLHRLAKTLAFVAQLTTSWGLVAMPLHAQVAGRAAIVQQLRSRDWNDRAAAFEKLSADSSAFASPSMATELLRLLETEYEVIASTIRQSRGRVTTDDKYGEEFGEYEAQVFHLCTQFCNKGGLVRHMLHAARPGSETRHGDLEVIGVVFDRGFSDQQRDQLSDALIVGAGDSTSNFVRFSSLAGINGALKTGLVSTTRLDRMRQVAITNAIPHERASTER